MMALLNNIDSSSVLAREYFCFGRVFAWEGPFWVFNENDVFVW
jgi:hypothetical protein